MTEPLADAQAADPVRALRHELRTPVNHIVGFGELLLEDAEASGSEALIEGLKEVVAGGRRALTTIDEILGSAAAGAGAPEPSRASSALAAIADQVMRRCVLLQESAARMDPSIVADLQKIEAAARQLAGLAAQQVPSLAGTTTGSTARPPGKATVLVVDDNEANREMLGRRVERLGHDVTLAGDGRQALEIMLAQPVDVVLLDIMMPEMDGYAVLERRQTDSRLRDIPVIMISAVDEIDSVARCITLGAEDYLPKPFNPVLLKARLDASLDKKHRRDIELAYLRNVTRLSEAAAAVEAKTFQPESLADIAVRQDELGQLARVFLGMVREVQAREQQLRAQLKERSYVFMSYASADRERALQIVSALESAGVRVWVDRHDIAAGTNWGAEIVQSIRGCTALLVACSKTAMQSRNVRQEIQLAWKYSRPYVPLLLEPTEFPDDIEYRLEGWQWVELLDQEAGVWLPRLLQALERLGVETQAPGSAVPQVPEQ
jgi:CheY-like chemotaxis protein